MRLLPILAGLISALLLGSSSHAKPPNFLILFVDDLGAAELGCYGNKVHLTPHIDQLAREGTRFETCFATPICSPSRVLLMTGRYGFRTGWNNLIGLPGSPTHANPDYDLGSAEITFAEVLKKKGYATALAGKWQLTGTIPDLIHDCGFDVYRMWAYEHNLPPGVTHTGGRERDKKPARFWHPSLVENGKYLPTNADHYGPDLFADFLIAFMRENKERPFVAYYPMVHTHPPYDEVPDPANPGKRLAKGFQNNVEAMDRVVGRLVAALDQLGLARETIVIFTSDNGTAGNGKGTATELGVRVPFIVRCPGKVPSGKTSRELVDLSDVLPTLAEWSGAKLPKDVMVDGKSLVPYLSGKTRHHREWIFSAIRDERILRDKRWLWENGRFYDCGDSREGVAHYRDVTSAMEPEILEAKERFSTILRQLPATSFHREELRTGEKAQKKKERRQRKKEQRNLPSDP